MYNIYDLELKKDLIASLSYIALESNFKFNNKTQFNNIMYRLYNHVKDDISFNNGIAINDNLKAKLNGFKNVFQDLNTPELSDSEELIGTSIQNQSTATVDFEGTKYTISTEEIIYFPYVFKPVAASGELYINLRTIKTTGREKAISASFTALNVGSKTSTIKIGFKAANQSTITIYMSTYDSSGAFIRTLSISRDLAISDYPEIRIDNIYNSGADMEVYKLIEYDFSIDGTQLAEINADKLNIGDIYLAESITFLEDGPITIYNVDNKFINGVSTESEYQFLKEKLGTTHSYNGNELKFMVVLANEDRSDFMGIISSYPLYYAEGYDYDRLIGLSNTIGTPVEIYTSTNSRLWQKLNYGYTNDAFDSTSGSLLVKTYPIHKDGLNIVYNNYPIYHSFKDYTTFVEPVNVDDENLEDSEISTLEEPITTLEERKVNGSILELYKTASEDFTIDLLPPGANIFLGKHRIEDSSSQKLVWRVLDYSNNINNVANTEKYPINTTLLQTAHVVDYLPLIPKNYYSRQEMQFGNLPIYRWLNSDAKQGEWFTQINSYDLPPDETNCGQESYVHRAGFVHYWAKEELDLLKPITVDNYEGLKILNLNSNEHNIAGASNEKPFLHSILGTSLSVKNFIKIMDYHKNTAMNTSASTDLDIYSKTKSISSYHCRQKESNGVYGASNSLSSSGNFAYLSRALAPICCIDKSTPINKDSAENGVFTINVNIPETIDVDNRYSCERTVTVRVEVEATLERNVIEDIFYIAKTERRLGLKGEFLAKTERELKATGLVLGKTVRSLKSNVNKSYKTSRTANFFFVYRFKSKRNLTKNISKAYSADRSVVVENRVDFRVPTKRYLTENISIVYKNKFVRDVKGILSIVKTTKRNLRANVNESFETTRNAITYKQYDFKTFRRVQYTLNKAYKTKRNSAINYTYEFNSIRIVKEFKTFTYSTIRKVNTNLSIESDTKRKLNINATWVGLIERLLAEKYSKDVFIQRCITENINLDYRALRNVIVNEVLKNDLLREVVMSTSFENRIERYITENFELNKETERRMILDMSRINEAMRYTLANADEESPTKRVLSTDEDTTKYVSKHNLLVYTNLLRGEIIDLVDTRIEVALASRGL